MDGRTSPVFEAQDVKSDLPKTMRNGDMSGDEQYKIDRICIRRKAECIVSNVISPSCIWLKLTNHITEQLQITNLDTLVPLPEVTEGLYVMAPLNEGLYARARIVQLAVAGSKNRGKAGLKYARVIFIDEGTTTWMSSACLAKMDQLLYFHPWQAIAVSLFNVRPKNNTKWSEEECKTLRAILSEYPMVQVIVAFSDQSANKYRNLIKVNMLGMKSVNDSQGNSIVHLLARQCRGVAYDRSVLASSAYKVYPTSVNVEDSGSSLDNQFVEMENWKKHFPKKSNKKSDEFEDECFAFTEKGIAPQITVVDVDWLRAEGYVKEGVCVVNAEGRYTVSPYEFYVRPLLMKNSKQRGCEGGGDVVGCVEDAMIAAIDELLKLADDVNSFYGNPRNRRPINVQRVRKALEEGRSVYGIAEVDEEVARFMGSWQRVEIIGLKPAVEKPEEDYCRVRFLDSGGTDIRLLANVFEIYPAHCQMPPLCLQVCLQGIKPVQGDEWSTAARQFFSHELREDVPISLKVIGALNKRERSMKLSYDSIACRRANVIFVSNLQVLDGSSESLDSRLVHQGYAIWSANSPASLHHSSNDVYA